MTDSLASESPTAAPARARDRRWAWLAAVVPLALITLSRGLRSRFDRHVAVARWTFPIWLYVSVTGVIVYLMLYRF